MKYPKHTLECLTFNWLPSNRILAAIPAMILILLVSTEAVRADNFFLPPTQAIFVVDPDSGFTTIQSAIDMSANGDLILVPAGTYNEQLDFSGKNVTVKSVDGPDVTIIDGGNTESVVVFENGESFQYFCNVTQTYVTDPWLCPGNDVSFHGAVLDGFTITGGGFDQASSDSPGWGDAGAGNTNTPPGTGAAGNGVGGFGLIFQPGNPKNEDSRGGGIRIRNASPALRNLIIKENSSDEGGGIYFFNSASVGMNILLYNNEAHGGGGIFITNSPKGPKFLNATITLNTAESGGGVYVSSSGKFKLANSIVWDNEGEEIFKQMDGFTFFPTVKVAASNVEGAGSSSGPPPGSMSACETFSSVEMGVKYICCIDQDPQFVNPEEGNFCIEDDCTQTGGVQTPAIISEVSIDFPLQQDLRNKDYHFGPPSCVPGYNSKEMGALAICDPKKSYTPVPVSKPAITAYVQPNPVKKSAAATISVRNEFLSEGFLQIRDRYQRIVSTKPVSADLEQEIDISALSLQQGLYYITIYAGGRQTGLVFMAE